MIEHGSY